eukprot:GILK01002198.1.p1 GENE.GILK01002198.1~~GILK01002198.1.p1  ORF type:complete len:267 (+),score=43.48 GILK01002198.1:54-803(+)
MVDFLVLDPRIRDWVLLPIVVVMFLVGIVRDNVSKLLKSEPKVDAQNVKNNQIMKRALLLRTHAQFLSDKSFRIRKSFFNHKEHGVLNQTVASSGANPLMDPSNMMNMMKGNMTMFIPQMALMGWVNFFFSGYLVAKVPFPLTLGFRGMLQRGVELNSLDVTYVTSLSWYFLILFGLRGLYSLFLGENSATDDTQIMQQQMAGMGGMGGPQAPDMKKMFASEKENLELVQHTFAPADAEARVIAKFRRQ